MDKELAKRLLALARKAHDDDTISIVARTLADGSTVWMVEAWYAFHPEIERGPYVSEAEALVAALEAAP